MDTSKLAPETRPVWELLAKQPALGGFVLIGGTALTMHIGHRISEDLDFITTGMKLPRTRLDALLILLEHDGSKVIRDDNPAIYEEFLIAGSSLHDYQQNFLIDGVKVNIFAAEPDLAGMIEPSAQELVRVATLHELFRTKALAAANRSLSRDWIDLFVLFRQCGFTLSDFHDAFHRPGIHNPAQSIARAFDNLCRGGMSVSDPGYETLMPNAPSLADLAAFFALLRDEYETSQARRIISGA